MGLKASGHVFAVKSLTADYHAPAQLDDELQVETKVESVGGAKIVFDQKVFRGETLLFSSLVTVAYMTDQGRPARLDPQMREKLQQFAA